MDQELALISTDDLLSELERRFDALVFMGYRLKCEETGNYAVKEHHFGDRYKCMGMAHHLASSIDKIESRQLFDDK